MSSHAVTEPAHAVSRRTWGRAVAVAIVLSVVLSAFLVAQMPAVGTSRPSIGLPRVLPEYMRYVQVNDYRFDPLVDTLAIPSALRYEWVPPDVSTYYIVQFNGPVTPDMKRSLASTGAEILHYIPYNAFVVRADAATLDRASILPVVRWTGLFEPAYKLSPRLSERYDEIVQRALDRNLFGADPATGDPMVSYSGMVTSKSLVPEAVPGASPSFGPSVFREGLTSLSPSATTGPVASVSGELGRGVKIDTSTRVPVILYVFERSRVMEVGSALRSLGADELRVSFGGSGTIKATVPRTALTAIAREPGVLWIDRDERPYVFNDIARWVIQSGDTDTFATPVHDQGIWGTGQTVTLGDTGIDFEHNAFEDPDVPEPGPTHRKVTDYYPGCTDGCDDTDNGINHGTHTAGSVGGDDGTWHVYDGDATGSNGTTGPHDGQAFDAFLQMQDLSNDGFFVYFDDILDLWNFAVDRDSWIHSNSWGSCCSEYIPDAAATDDFVWNNQDFIIVFAAGNSGSGLNSMNPYAGAKNVIAVGATSNGAGLENIAGFSSRGPMGDGRLKPDVMAPGVSVWSAEGCDPGGECDTYFQLSGTSMATPTAAGAAALVRQYFMDGWYPTGSPEGPNAFTPTAALVKGMLINSAVEMTGSGAYDNDESRYPNFNQGWGRLLLDDAMFFTGEVRGLSIDDNRGGIDTGASVLYQLAIGDPSEAVEITLVWSDFPGTPGSSPNLVNDLDLVVTAPDGTFFRGNQYAGFNPGESERNPNGSDHLNNVEGVLVLSDIQAGLWTVEVSGFDIPQGPQPYALVMTGGIATKKGIIQMDKNRYQSSATVSLRVVDTDLDTDPGAPDTVDVDMTSDTETSAEVVTLTETGDSTSVFAGSIDLENAAAVPGDGFLQVSDGDTIVAEYFDADDGLGGSGPTTDTAIVDDTSPVISDVAATNLRFNRATILWTTDEPADSVVHYGASAPPGATRSDARRVLSHSVTLSGLVENTTYYFSVESTDEAGNTALDDNGSAYYSFVTPAKPPTAPPDDEWPTFHNNPPRQGISPSAFDPPIDREWSSGPYLLQLWNGPVLADGILFSAPLDGNLRARDPYTGDILWERRLGGQYYYTGTMTADNGVLYATFYSNAGGFVYALDEFTGDTIWSVGLDDASLDFNARIAMALADDLVFGSAWGGEIYALNAADGSVAWTYNTGDLPFGGPTVNAGILYMGTTGGTVYALDEFSGDLVWSVQLDEVVTSPPLYAQGNVYVGTYAGTMFALDAFTGEEVWSTGGFELIDLSTPAYDGASIYFGDFAAEYVSLDATDGTVLWRTSIGGPVGSSVAYANGYVYGTAWDGPLRVLDAFDGTIVDQESLNSFASTSSPAISDGWVWVEDYDGNIFGFLGQLPVGLTVSPSRQSQDAVPDSTVDYAVRVTNVGVSGPDTFDATMTLGGLGWATDLFEADSSTPLGDTDADGIPDTGSLATDESTMIVIRVTVPAAVSPGDSDTATVTFTSSNDVSRSKDAVVRTIVPPPGVTVGPRAYFTPNPGDTVSAAMDVRNTGGFDDTIDMRATSDRGWTIRLLDATGTAPLTDTDDDGIPDVGLVPGLRSATITVEVDVPAGTPVDTLQRAQITGTSSLDPSAEGSGFVVIELIAPPDEAWPTFHNNKARHGQSPSPHEPPLTEHWRSPANLQHLWAGPVVAEGILFSTTLDGYIRARDPFSGDILWELGLGGTYYYTGTPTVADGTVYTTMYGDFGGYVYALDAFTGDIVWSVGYAETGLDFNARIAMALADDLVFGSAWGGEIYALNAADGSVAWTYDTGDLPFGGPTVSGGTVYVGSVDGASVYAIDEFTGDLVWRASLDNSVTSPPLFAQGNLYVGTYAGTMYALDALSGEIVWSTGGFGLIDFSTPAYDGTSIYFGDFNAEYVSLDVATGALNWRTSIGGPVGSSVAYANGYVYGTAWDGQLRTLEAATGRIVDTDALAAFGSTSMPAISRGWVWVEDLDGRIYGFGGVGAGEVREVVVTPGIASVPVTSAALFVARGIDAFGNPIPVGGASWSSLGGLGTLLPISDSTAIYVAGAVAGTDILQADAGGYSGTATVNVMPGSLDHVDILPGVASVAVGSVQDFDAYARDRFGNDISGATFTWAVTGGIGTVDSSGRFTAATAVGTGTVTARTGTITGTAIVEIVPGALETLALTPSPISLAAGSTLLLTAEGLDVYGNEISGLSFSWATTIGSVTPVGAGSPNAVLSAGYAAGSGTLTVASGGRTLMLAVAVTPGPLARIDLSPSPASVPAGGTLTIQATPSDLFGNPITGATIVWSASSSLGTITQAGVLTAATTVGSGTVTATSGSVSATVSVSIVPGPVAAILVSPSSVTVAAGSVVTLTATAQDQYGNALPFGVLTWAASAGTLLQLATDGRLVQYSAPTESGPETLTVSSGTVSRTVSVSVVAGPAAAIVLSGPASVQAGSAGNAYMATATDAYGNAVAAASIVWSTTSGSISTAGVLTAPTTAGTIVITAQAGGRQATVVVQVTAAAVDHLEVSPTSVSVQTGAGTLLSVVGRDQYGNAVSGLSYTWTTTIGTIVPGPNGGATASFFSGDAGGSGTITVSAAGETASVGVTVSESSLPLVRQATSPTSLLFLVVAILAIAASIFLYGRYRAAQGEIEEMRKGGQGGGQTGGPGDVG